MDMLGHLFGFVLFAWIAIFFFYSVINILCKAFYSLTNSYIEPRFEGVIDSNSINLIYINCST